MVSLPSAFLSKNAPLCWTWRDLEIVIQIFKRQSKTLHAVMCFELQMCCIMTAFSMRASPFSVCCLTRITFDFIKKLTGLTATHNGSYLEGGWVRISCLSFRTLPSKQQHLPPCPCMINISRHVIWSSGSVLRSLCWLFKNWTDRAQTIIHRMAWDLPLLLRSVSIEAETQNRNLHGHSSLISFHVRRAALSDMLNIRIHCSPFEEDCSDGLCRPPCQTCRQCT